MTDTKRKYKHKAIPAKIVNFYKSTYNLIEDVVSVVKLNEELLLNGLEDGVLKGFRGNDNKYVIQTASIQPFLRSLGFKPAGELAKELHNISDIAASYTEHTIVDLLYNLRDAPRTKLEVYRSGVRAYMFEYNNAKGAIEKFLGKGEKKSKKAKKASPPNVLSLEQRLYFLESSVNVILDSSKWINDQNLNTEKLFEAATVTMNALSDEIKRHDEDVTMILGMLNDLSALQQKLEKIVSTITINNFEKIGEGVGNSKEV